MNLLTLDLSSNVGWSVGPIEGPFRSGAYRIPSGSSLGVFLCDFEKWVIPMLESIDLCIFEAPIMPRYASFDIVRKLTGLAGVTEMQCQKSGIEVLEANNMSVKKFMGHGGMKKDEMIEAVRRYGYDPLSHDEADAIALRFYTLAKRFPNVSRKMNLELGALGAA